MNRLQILYTPCALLTRCSGHTTSQAKKNKTNRTKKSSTHIICWMPMSHKEQLSKGHRRCRSERRKGSQPRNQTPDSQKGVACFSTFKQVFRFFSFARAPPKGCGIQREAKLQSIQTKTPWALKNNVVVLLFFFRARWKVSEPNRPRQTKHSWTPETSSKKELETSDTRAATAPKSGVTQQRPQQQSKYCG